MNKLFVEGFWILFVIIILVLGLVTPYFPVAILIGSLVAIWRFIKLINRSKNRHKKIENEIPQELLEDFHEAERRWVLDGGKTEPHEILWQIARERREGSNRLSRTTERESSSSLRKPIAQTINRSEFQNSFDTGDTISKKSISGTKSDNKRFLFGRKIR